MATITGTEKNDRLFGTSSDDTIDARGGNDRVSAQGGHDRITGGPGNDRIDGGAGTDTAVFAGVQDGYTIRVAHGPVRIRDTDHQDGNDGQDIVAHVERLAFADATVYLVPDIPPVAGDDALATEEDSPVTVSAASLLANDRDADGDPLTISGLDPAGTQGTVTDNGDGTLTYDPGAAFQDLAAGESATDSSRYTVSDGQGGTDSATVTVTIAGADERPAVINLGDLDGTYGFKMIGEAAGDQAGSSVSSAGDVNGDGLDDVIVGAFFDDAGGDYAGAAYVVFGKVGGFGTVDLADVAQGAGGFKILGEGAGNFAGFSVSGAGDVNGDGFGDVIVGAGGNNVNGPYSGAAYVVFGKAGGFDTVDLGDIAAGTGGFKIAGEGAFDQAGYSVSSAGDVNGDGFDDVIVGAPGEYALAAYVVFGKASGFDTVNLSDVAAGTGGFKIIHGGFYLGSSVATAGDVDGDGFDDVIVGAPDSNVNGEYTGAAYVVFGKAGGFDTVDLGDVAAGVGGFQIIGEASGDQAGSSVATAGDVNGDGFDDVIVGAYGNAAGGDRAGAAYVVFGKAGGSGPVNLDDVAAGIGGFKIVGEAAYDYAAGGRYNSVSAAGDVNGDGFGDLLVGAPRNDANGDEAGAAYLVFGKASGFGTVNLDDVAAGTGGFKMLGEAGSVLAGRSVSTAGDLNGDGFDDMIVGGGGAAYVVFGGPTTGATAQVADHPPEDTLL